ERDGKNVVELRRQAEKSTTGPGVPEPGGVVAPPARGEAAVPAERDVGDLSSLLQLVGDAARGELDDRRIAPLAQDRDELAVGTGHERYRHPADVHAPLEPTARRVPDPKPVAEGEDALAVARELGVLGGLCSAGDHRTGGTGSRIDEARRKRATVDEDQRPLGIDGDTAVPSDLLLPNLAAGLQIDEPRRPVLAGERHRLSV